MRQLLAHLYIKMGVRNELEQHIISSWQDRQVAEWVVDKLPLIEMGDTHPSCPTFNLSLDNGLLEEHGGLNNIQEKLKFVMSGGFEGTKAHITAVEEMQDVRTLTFSRGNIIIMLEPDSYIKRYKERDPIVNLEQRSYLWSTSGLVDAVIRLPEKKESTDTKEHYMQIHQHIKPAAWLTNAENPNHLQILLRSDPQSITLGHVFVHQPEVHASFLHSTMDLSLEELKGKLLDYSALLSNKRGPYALPRTATQEQISRVIYERLSREL